MNIPAAVDRFSEFVARCTKPFIEHWTGRWFLATILLGPLTFVPTVWLAWTAPNIDALRTLTWPLMIIVNIASFLNVAHRGNWQMRLVMIIWAAMIAAVFAATLIR